MSNEIPNIPASSRLRHKARENQWRAMCRKGTLKYRQKSIVKLTSLSQNSQSSPESCVIHYPKSYDSGVVISYFGKPNFKLKGFE